jgi:dihydrofolate reductase
MPELFYLAITSVDGYVEDARGKFDWAAPDVVVHSFINDLMEPVGTYLYGRRMYETMLAWETITEGEHHIQEFARIWRAADKVVFSRSLTSVSSERTRIEKEFRPDLIRSWVAASSGGAGIGGAELASAALASQLVDEYHLLIAPYVAGGGKRALPEQIQLRLELTDEKRFPSGMVYLRYRIGY